MEKKVEVKYISENEIFVGENKVSLLKGNVYYVVSSGEQTQEIADFHRKLINKYLSSVEGNVNFLIDLNKCGKNSPEARQIWKQLAEMERTEKVALFGLHPVARVIASFVIDVTKRKNMHFFSSKEEAMNWLKIQTF